MANTFAVSRNHMIFGLCLPLAVLLGYLLADPLESSSLAVIVMVASILILPLIMRWHHVLLILSWNATVTSFFLPGRPQLWMLCAFVSLFFAVLGRSVSAEKQFLFVPSITKALGLFLVIVMATACFTGGIGMRSMGSNTYGGKNYFYIIAAVVGYFALTSRAIPRHRATLFVAMFFLPALSSLVSNLVYYFPSLWFLYEVFPVSYALEQAAAEWTIQPMLVRIGGVIVACLGVQSFMLARYGLRGVLDPAHPFRVAIFLVAGFVSLYGGFRSSLVFFGLLLVVLFFVEGLWRTRFAFVVAAVVLLAGVSSALFAHRLPFSVQRTLSFLPIDLDPMVKQSAQSSNEWRLEMWRALLPQIPHYLFKGKGYALSGRDLHSITDVEFQRGSTAASAAAGAAFANDYHNGPLSLVIPFGLYGFVAFTWLIYVGIRFLARNYRYGHPGLRRINGLLLALFVAKAIFFFGVFGSLPHDIWIFTGILGFSVSLNGGEAQPETEWEEGVLELQRA